MSANETDPPLHDSSIPEDLDDELVEFRSTNKELANISNRLEKLERAITRQSKLHLEQRFFLFLWIMAIPVFYLAVYVILWLITAANKPEIGG